MCTEVRHPAAMVPWALRGFSMGFARKLKRKQFNMARKQFMKDFKTKMKEFKKQVKCTKCDYQPQPGENIDDWHIDKDSQGIDLICTNCYTGEETKAEDEEF